MSTRYVEGIRFYTTPNVAGRQFSVAGLSTTTTSRSRRVPCLAESVQLLPKPKGLPVICGKLRYTCGASTGNLFRILLRRVAGSRFVESFEFSTLIEEKSPSPSLFLTRYYSSFVDSLAPAVPATEGWSGANEPVRKLRGISAAER